MNTGSVSSANRVWSARSFKRAAGALKQPSLRLFLFGSFLSNIGTWMQTVAQAWLVLQITNSPFYLGLDGFASTLPLMIFAFAGGVFADRMERRGALLATQWVMLGLAAVLGLLTQFHLVRVWHVIAISFLTGLTQSLAWPLYQSVLANLVPREHLTDAIALNSVQFNLARCIGPLVGALGLSLLGTAGCFYANAVSFVAVLIAIGSIHVMSNRHDPRTAVGGIFQTFHEGIGYVRSAPALGWLMLTLAMTSIFGVPVMTMLPVFARDILKIGSSGFGVLTGSVGAGAVFAGMFLVLSGDFPKKGRAVLISIGVFIVGVVGFAVSRNMLVSVLCLFVDGFCMVGFASVTNTIVQASVPDAMRGRAMSLFVFCFGGCMPIGNLLVGWLAKLLGAPHSLLAMAAILGAYGIFIWIAHPEIQDLR